MLVESGVPTARHQHETGHFQLTTRQNTMPRVILLGASNVTLSFPRLWHGLRRALAEPLELFAAHGHGRSFGNWSRIGPRELPSIVNCRLWDELAALPATNEPPRALVTDIGNDILYGVSPSQIAAWVETCLQRLTELRARIVLTQLPVANTADLGKVRFGFFRSLFFPGCSLTLREVVDRATWLNQRVIELGHRFDVSTPAPRREWYGLDPIHVLRRHRDSAWREILSAWFEEPQTARFPEVDFRASLRLWRQRPAQCRWFGREQRQAQPVLREPDNSTLWLY